MVRLFTPFQGLMAILFATAKKSLQEKDGPVLAPKSAETTALSDQPRSHFQLRACGVRQPYETP
jgi:hypothetical protein